MPDMDESQEEMEIRKKLAEDVGGFSTTMESTLPVTGEEVIGESAFSYVDTKRVIEQMTLEEQKKAENALAGMIVDQMKNHAENFVGPLQAETTEHQDKPGNLSELTIRTVTPDGDNGECITKLIGRGMKESSFELVPIEWLTPDLEPKQRDDPYFNHFITDEEAQKAFFPKLDLPKFPGAEFYKKLHELAQKGTGVGQNPDAKLVLSLPRKPGRNTMWKQLAEQMGGVPVKLAKACFDIESGKDNYLGNIHVVENQVVGRGYKCHVPFAGSMRKKKYKKQKALVDILEAKEHIFEDVYPVSVGEFKITHHGLAEVSITFEQYKGNS